MPKPKDSEEEIAAKREARARKREQQASQNPDELLDTTSHSLVYNFRNHQVTIEEDWSGDGSALAGLQWLGGVLLARFFDGQDHFPPGYFHGKRVLEVGAGCGLTSILLVHLGADVTVTDLDMTKALPNIETNLDPEVVTARLHIHELDWTQPFPSSLEPPFDIIVAGDCCYDAACLAPLFSTMTAAANPSTDIFLCGIVGDKVLDHFNLLIGQYFTVERLTTEDDYDESIGFTRSKGADAPDNRLRALLRLKLPRGTEQNRVVAE